MSNAELRVIPDRARYLFPFEAMVAAHECPLCRCWRSGDEDIPNARTEACDNSRCPCHFDCEDAA